MPARKNSSAKKDWTTNLGLEAEFWLAADKLPNNMDALELSRATHCLRNWAARRFSGGAQSKIKSESSDEELFTIHWNLN